MTENKWILALRHFFPSLAGFVRTVFQHPVFASRLLAVRAGFFLTRRVDRPLETPDGFRIGTPAELISYWSLFIERDTWSPIWADALRTEPHPFVLDVGANAGVFTHRIWTLRPDAEMVAFEPLPRMAAQLREWQKRTGARLTINAQAVSDHCGEAKFFACTENDTSASLKPKDSPEPPTTVPLVTIDSLFAGRPVFLFKLDVEGMEPEALAGSKQTLPNVKFLIAEAHTPEALKKITDVLGTAWNCHQVGASDYLFSRPS
jgi:FkbM family methyltransferase